MRTRGRCTVSTIPRPSPCRPTACSCSRGEASKRPSCARMHKAEPYATFLHIHAAVDGEHVPGDVGGLFAGQELHRVGDVLGLADACLLYTSDAADEEDS